MSLASISAGNSSTAGKSDAALSQLSQDYTKFMKLLVAQIQHQDPMEPVDSTQFVSQIAQLTQVEQAVETNKHIEGLRSSLALSSAMFETAFIGREVTVEAETFVIDEDGGSFSYELEENASDVQAIITDAAGKEVHRIGNLSTTGQQIVDVRWDGRNGNGDQLPAGVYHISIAANGSTGGYNTFTNGSVTSVEYLRDKQMLRLSDGRLIDSGDIVRAS